MSAFNVLKISLNCSKCNSIVVSKIQFKYGDTWQFEYAIGDELKWGGNDIGESKFKRVKVLGAIESTICSSCNQTGFSEDYEIIVESNLIRRVYPILDIEEYIINNSDFILLDDK